MSETQGLLGGEGGIYREPGRTGILDELSAAGWTATAMDGGADKAMALAGIASALGFESWFGGNLDALWDSLRDLEIPTALVWRDWEEFAVASPEDWAALLGVLRERTTRTPAFAVVLT